MAGGRERAATPCFSGLLWGELQLHSPSPPAPLALFQRFTSQLTSSPAGVWAAPSSSSERPSVPRGAGSTGVHASLPPPCRHIHAVCPAICAPSPGRIGGPLGVTVLECSWRHGGLHLHPHPCPRLGLWPPLGPERRAGQRLPQHSGGARQAFFHPACSFQDWFPRNAPHARRSPGPTGRPAVTSPQGAVRGLGEAGVGPTFAGAGVAPSPSASLSRGRLLRALAPGHVPPAFLQPRCRGRDANTGGSLGGPHGTNRQ